MYIQLKASKLQPQTSSIQITGSKSESNRLLILQALYPNITIKNLSNSDDTLVLQKALKAIASPAKSTYIDVHHAGTAMRFLTAFSALQHNSEITLTGSERMQQRPIGVLVDALNRLGANISYLNTIGFPPLKISGTALNKKQVTIPANISSQYISALLLIAPKLQHGLQITLQGQITSAPYINMTLQLLNALGVQTQFKGQHISVKPQLQPIKSQTLTVESDWSSASYWYSLIALSPQYTSITIGSYNAQSLQGDAVLADIYTQFGVTTAFNAQGITLTKTSNINQETQIHLNLVNAPDIAQTIAVTAFGLGLTCQLTGLHTLKIKETDRLVALQTELQKFGAQVSITKHSLRINTTSETTIAPNVQVETYNDHRMAMAFAPLALKTNLTILNANVVSKSYPEFWDNLKTVGVNMQLQNS